MPTTERGQALMIEVHPYMSNVLSFTVGATIIGVCYEFVKVAQLLILFKPKKHWLGYTSKPAIWVSHRLALRSDVMFVVFGQMKMPWSKSDERYGCAWRGERVISLSADRGRECFLPLVGWLSTGE